MAASYVTIKAQLSKEEKNALKQYAKGKGMTLQGFLAIVLKEELKKAQVSA